MNEQLATAITALINQSLALFNQGVSFLSQEIPDVVHQLLMWQLIQSLIYTVGAAIGTAICIGLWIWVFKICLKIHRKEKESNYLYDGFVHWFPFNIGTILYAFIYCIFIYSYFNLTWLQIWIAPKVYLIEYATKLIK